MLEDFIYEGPALWFLIKVTIFGTLVLGSIIGVTAVLFLIVCAFPWLLWGLVILPIGFVVGLLVMIILRDWK